MNEQKALELGKKLYANITNSENNIIKTNDYIEFVGIAIKALEEEQQYRAIGTVEEFRAAVEKQKEARNTAIDDFLETAMKQFTDFDLKHGYPTVADCKVILRDVAEQLKGDGVNE